MRVLLVTGPDDGHALPILGVARALRSRGHDTVVATGTQHQALARAEGHRFLELPMLAPTPRDGDFGYLLWERAGEMAPPLHALVIPLAPDVVVVDTLTTVGAFVADMLGVPWVEVAPHHLTDPDPLVPPVGLGAPPAATAAQRADHDRIRAAQTRSIAEGTALRDRVRATIGLGPATAPVARLLQTAPTLEPARARWPVEAHVVGALAIDPPLPPLAPPRGDAPLVVVTDSTATGLASPLGSTALAAFGGPTGPAGPAGATGPADALGRAVRLVVTSGALAPVTRPGVTVGRGPHGPLLDEAAVAVGPGGGGFVAKALARGVPLVVVPLAGDQLETAARVERAGLGVRLDPQDATPETLAAAVACVLDDDRHRRRAAAVAAELVDLGPGCAAALIERAVGAAEGAR